jgi:hypothetical protein
MHQAILLTLWRSWHLRNNIYHDKGKATIEQSAIFLLSYANTLNTNHIATIKTVWTDKKGKKPMGESQPGSSTPPSVAEVCRLWEPPPTGMLKVNVDGSFVPQNGTGTTGVVIRDHLGRVIVAAGTLMPCCTSTEEAAALLEGARLAMDWTNLPVIFESDCATVVQAVHQGKDSMSHLRTFF